MENNVWTVIANCSSAHDMFILPFVYIKFDEYQKSTSVNIPAVQYYVAFHTTEEN